MSQEGLDETGKLRGLSLQHTLPASHTIDIAAFVCYLRCLRDDNIDHSVGRRAIHALPQ